MAQEAVCRPQAAGAIVSAEVRLLREFHASALQLAAELRPKGPTLPGTNRVRALLERLSTHAWAVLVGAAALRAGDWV